MIELDNKDKQNLELTSKECLICLDKLNYTLDIESNTNLVKLPCACSSNIYHRECIDKMLNSGLNKNFCPHCKQSYSIPNILLTEFNNQMPNREINPNEIVNISEFITMFEYREFERKIKKHIFISHIFVNMLTNISMVVIIATNNNFVLFHSNKYTSGLFIFGLFKTLFNNLILLYSGDYPNQIDKFILFSYFIQISIIIFFGFTFNKIERITSVLLTINFLLTIFIDFCTRMFFERDLEKWNLRVRNL